MTRSYRQIAEFLAAARIRLSAKESTDAHGKDRTKFNYALRKVSKQCQTLWEKHLEEREDIEIDLAATNKDGVILRNAQGGLEFTKEGLKARAEKIRAAYAQEVEVTPFGAKYPSDITDDERDAFEGFVPDGPVLSEVKPAKQA